MLNKWKAVFLNYVTKFIFFVKFLAKKDFIYLREFIAMGLSIYLNHKKLNLTFSEVLAEYDSDKNGFTKQEFSHGLKNVTSIFARNIIKITGYDKKWFNEIDVDKNNIASYEEISDYIKKEYNLEFNKAKTMTLKELCSEVDKIEKNKKNAKE